jgi:hypothetical protein
MVNFSFKNLQIHVLLKQFFVLAFMKCNYNDNCLYFQPTIDVCICVSETLMDVQEAGIGNLMTLTMETMYSPPESWTMAGAQYAYATALPVPVSSDVC